MFAQSFALSCLKIQFKEFGYTDNTVLKYLSVYPRHSALNSAKDNTTDFLVPTGWTDDHASPTQGEDYTGGFENLTAPKHSIQQTNDDPHNHHGNTKETVLVQHKQILLSRLSSQMSNHTDILEKSCHFSRKRAGKTDMTPSSNLVRIFYFSIFNH